MADKYTNTLYQKLRLGYNRKIQNLAVYINDFFVTVVSTLTSMQYDNIMLLQHEDSIQYSFTAVLLFTNRMHITNVLRMQYEKILMCTSISMLFICSSTVSWVTKGKKRAA